MINNYRNRQIGNMSPEQATTHILWDILLEQKRTNLLLNNLINNISNTESNKKNKSLIHNINDLLDDGKLNNSTEK